MFLLSYKVPWSGVNNPSPPACVSLTPSQGETIDPPWGSNPDLPAAKSWVYHLYHAGLIFHIIVIVCYDLKCLLAFLSPRGFVYI